MARSKPPLSLSHRLHDSLPTRFPISLGRAELHLGSAVVECHVLDSTDRIVTMRSAVAALTGKDHGNLGEIAGIGGLKPFLNVDLVLGESREFLIPKTQFRGRGIMAEAFVDICEAFTRALERGTLRTAGQRMTAIRCAVMLGPCAKIGLVALIDEATGFQAYRAADDLQVRLLAILRDAPRTWEKTFPDALWHELARLTGHVGPVTVKRPQWWGKLVNEFVYRAMDEGIARHLVTEKPAAREIHYHSWFNEEYGLPVLRSHLDRVVGIAMCCHDLPEMRDRVAMAFKTRVVQLPLAMRAA